jgi:NAD(P)-dependent dehydrogenase (short-subunit alcohol dehydrogenase family)
LVNNAGVGAIGTVSEATEDEWVRVLNINVIGIGRVSAAAMPHLKQSKCAAIVNTCSLVATAGVPKRAVYGASKGAVYALTLAMAADGLADGVRVNCVNPGTSDTPWVKNLLAKANDPDKELAALQARQPLGRLVSPVEVASAIIYLANPAQASTTGTAIAVDGGMQGLRIPK